MRLNAFFFTFLFFLFSGTYSVCPAQDSTNTPAPTNSSAESQKNNLSVEFRSDQFSKVYDPMYYVTAKYTRTTSIGDITGGIHYANRFNSDGLQFDIESYPILSDKMYGYLGYAYSNSKLFTDHRLGAELFRALPCKFEGSLGIRYMHFQGGDDIIIYTGSLGYYVGNYWINLRPWFIPKNDGLTQSWVGTIRRYWGPLQHYWSLQFSAGVSPDTRYYPTDNGTGFSKQTLYFKSQSVRGELNYHINETYLLVPGLQIQRQELSFAPDEYVFVYSGYIRLNYRF